MKTTQKLDFILNLVDKMSNPMKGVSKSIIDAQRVASCGFNTMRDGALGVASAGYGLIKMIDPSRDYYKALGEVKSLGVAQSELDNLGASAMAYTQKYGGSVNDVIRSAYDIQSAINGLGQGELAIFNNAANLTAKATKATAADMTNYMGTMYGIFEADAKRMGNAKWADQLMGKTAMAVNKFKSTGPAMSAAFTNIGSDAQKMGISLDEQIGVLGTLQATMGGERAGSAYAAFVRSIPTAQGKGGLNFKDATGNAKPIFKIIDELKAKFGHLDAVSRANVIGKIFGSSEAVKVVNNLWDKTDGLKQSIDEISKINDLGDVGKMAAAMVDPLDMLKGAWDMIVLGISKELYPIINTVVGSIKWLFSYVQIVLDYCPWIKTTIAIIAGGFLALAGVISACCFILGAFKMLLGGTLATILTGIKVIKFFEFQLFRAQYYTTIWGVKTKILTMWQKISTTAIWAWAMACKGATAIANLVTGSIAWQIASYTAHKIAMYSSIVAIGVMKGAMAVLTVAQWAFNAALLASPITWIIALFVALNVVIALCVYYWDDIKAAALSAWEGIVSGLKWCWDLLKSFGSWLIDMCAGYFNFLKSILSTLFNGVITGITYCWNVLKNFGNWIVTTFLSTISNTLNFFNSLWQGLVSGLTYCWDSFKNFGKWVSDVFSVYFNFLSATVSTLFNGVIVGLIGCWDLIKSFGAWIADFFTLPVSSALNGFNSLWEGVVSGAKWCFSFIQPIFDNILGIWNSIGGIWDKITGVFTSPNEINATETLNKNINLENNSNLSADRVRPDFSNTKSVSNQINHKTSNYGGVKINVQGGFTPAQMTEWQALQI